MERSQAPELFEIIDELVLKTRIKSPRKVFISPGVNASVFYQNKFLSLFFPSYKSLDIGMGLICSSTTGELKAVLAHEFGHFAQKSMIIGTYVSGLNAIIYNILYKNESFNELADSLSMIHGIVRFFVSFSSMIVEGIQKILVKAYELLNINYLALSRQMEFNSDEVAVKIVGKKQFKTILNRMDFADRALAEVFSFYSKNYQNIPANLFSQFESVIQFLAVKNKINMVNGYPDLQKQDQLWYGKSKLNIEDQWATHPSLDERIAKIDEHISSNELINDNPATSIFPNLEPLQIHLTNQIFENVHDSKKIELDLNVFRKEYAGFYTERNFGDIFNNYYTDKTPLFYFEKSPEDTSMSISELFSDEAVSLVKEDINLEEDLRTLKLVSQKIIKAKKFKYDGIRYSSIQCENLISELILNQQKNRIKIKEHDMLISRTLYSLALIKGNEKRLINRSKIMIEYFDAMGRIMPLLDECYIRIEFFAESTDYKYISKYVKYWKEKEGELKTEIVRLLNDKIFREIIGGVNEEDYKKFSISNYSYFDGETTYFEDEVQHLFRVMESFPEDFNQAYMQAKKELLQLVNELLVNSAFKQKDIKNMVK
ncbi:MAG: M48 family metalloprotease [Cytophagales bacterium]|nr:M48 family metalloprotease [Cytophagales bacterium]